MRIEKRFFLSRDSFVVRINTFQIRQDTGVYDCLCIKKPLNTFGSIRVHTGKPPYPSVLAVK